MRILVLIILAFIGVTQLACRQQLAPAVGQGQTNLAQSNSQSNSNIQLAMTNEGSTKEDKTGVSQRLIRNQGGDQLPVVVDPSSPGSCALVAKGEMCGFCCGDVFIDESESWYQCMNTCAKSEASQFEH
jgi:hypothetical protein